MTNCVQGSVFCTMLKQKQINKTKQNKKKQSKTERRNSRNIEKKKEKKKKKRTREVKQKSKFFIFQHLQHNCDIKNITWHQYSAT